MYSSESLSANLALARQSFLDDVKKKIMQKDISAIDFKLSVSEIVNNAFAIVEAYYSVTNRRDK